jgi:hypothetical protein
MFVFARLVFSDVLLNNGLAAGNKVDQDHDDGDDQQNVNEPAHRVAGYQPEQPQND